MTTLQNNTHHDMLTLRDEILFTSCNANTPPSFHLPKKGIPGNLFLFGKNCIPLVTAGNTVIAAAAISFQHNNHNNTKCGRVVAIAHEAYIQKNPNPQNKSVSHFLNLIVSWLGGWDQLYLLSHDQNTPHHLTQARQHFEKGKGVLVASCPWGWLQLNPGKSLQENHMGNAFLAPLGMVFTNEYCDAKGPFLVQNSSQCREEIMKLNFGLGLHCHDENPKRHSEESTIVQRRQNHVVDCIPGKLQDAKKAYQDGGWWPPASNHVQLFFTFPKPISIAQIKVWTVNVDACPKRLKAYTNNNPTRPQKDSEWTFIGDFEVQTRNDPKNAKQNKPHLFSISQENIGKKTRHVKLLWTGIHNSYYMGVNDIWFYSPTSTHPALRHHGKTIKAQTLQCIPLKHRASLLQELRPLVATPHVWPSPEHALAVDSEEAQQCSLLLAMAAVGDGPSMKALESAARHFPGVPSCADQKAMVDRNAPVKMHCNATKEGGGKVWHSTHCYALPGQAITVTFTSKNKVQEGRWQVRIGCHSDSIDQAHHKAWKRMPCITTTAPLLSKPDQSATNATTMSLVSPFGGLVFIEQLHPQASDITCSIHGGIPSPHYNATTQTLHHQDSPAPWGELSTKHLSLCLPSPLILQTWNSQPQHIHTAMQFWDNVVTHHHQLASPPYQTRQERIVVDVQISNGYMHSGYPIMAHLDFASKALQVDVLQKEGNWGMFHELGHNMQRSWWTWRDTTEVTVNLFTMYTMETLVGNKRPKGFALVGTEKGRQKVRRWVEGGKERRVWNEDPFLALGLYMQLVEGFGWEVLKQVLISYEVDHEAFKRGKGEKKNATVFSNGGKLTGEDKMKEWARRYMQVVKRDLSPFFAQWGFSVASQPQFPPWTCDLVM